MTLPNESKQPFNDALLEPLEFEEVLVEPPPMGGIVLPPVRQRARYTTKWSEDDTSDSEPIEATIFFELCYDYDIPEELVEQLKDEMRVYCGITFSDEREAIVMRGSIDQSPEEDGAERVAERRANLLNEAGPGTILTKLMLSPDDRERLSPPYKLRVEIDPIINANFGHLYAFEEQVAVVNVNVTCSAGSVDASLTLGGSAMASAAGVVAALSTGVRSPDLVVRGREDGSKYRVSGSIDVF